MTSTPTPLRLENNYTPLYAALGAGVMMTGIAIFALVRMGGDAEQLGWLLLIFGGLWGFIIAALGITNHLKVTKERHDAESLFADDQWAEWRYTMAEWQQELTARQADLERRKRFGRFAPIMGTIAAVVIGGTILMIAWISGDDMPAEVRQFLVVLAVFFALLTFGLSISGTMREQRKWRDRLERASQVAAPWVRLGAYGFYHETDGHTTLRSLHSVDLSKDGAALRFLQKHPGPRGSTLYKEVLLPIPAQHGEDAQALVARYRRERSLRT
jgi:hypothetical protein